LQGKFNLPTNRLSTKARVSEKRFLPEEFEVRDIAQLRIDEMVTEFRMLSENLKELERSGNGAIAEPLRNRLLELTHGIANATAENAADLALKATVAMTWIEQSDVPSMVLASVCRDVVLLFPGDT
jgi:hypothetical protein